MGNLRFNKKERIKSKKVIDELFLGNSKSFTIYPIRVVYKSLDKQTKEQAQILLSVPKKKFKSAVDRNHIKRLFRESYRLNKAEFIEYLKTNDTKLAIALIYLSKEIIKYEEMEKKMKKLLLHIEENTVANEKTDY